jgi:hypothetical protein
MPARDPGAAWRPLCLMAARHERRVLKAPHRGSPLTGVALSEAGWRGAAPWLTLRPAAGGVHCRCAAAGAGQCTDSTPQEGLPCVGPPLTSCAAPPSGGACAASPQAHKIWRHRARVRARGCGTRARAPGARQPPAAHRIAGRPARGARSRARRAPRARGRGRPVQRARLFRSARATRTRAPRARLVREGPCRLCAGFSAGTRRAAAADGHTRSCSRWARPGAARPGAALASGRSPRSAGRPEGPQHLGAPARVARASVRPAAAQRTLPEPGKASPRARAAVHRRRPPAGRRGPRATVGCWART